MVVQHRESAGQAGSGSLGALVPLFTAAQLASCRRDLFPSTLILFVYSRRDA